ncbi:homeobox protein 12-like isoform X2 [Temnothorax curvispinosus]|uniref:Homeobox protein 12-like isoform X2 n=1 Tax=Temnothorax curvispinosus TaxID=300111 RepID=A0A6J1RBR0_9HYME|nr:homeobox protein 12-like isoform X2 [Temnothorax curvispinosus]
MGRYHNYLEDKFQKVPRTSQYRRNHTEYELSVQSSDDSVEDAQWREYCNCQSSSDSNNTDSDSTSQHNSIRSSSSNEALPAVTHENTFIEQNNNQQSSSILEQTADASQISRNDRNQLYGLSDSEDENFQDSWVYDAHEELFQFSDEDDNDNDDDDVCEEVSSEDVNSENNYIGFSRLIEMTQKDENNETINAQVVVSKAEILLAVLKYGITYCLSQSALADLFKMLNCFFNFSLLPSTRYLVDQMFNPETVIEYSDVIGVYTQDIMFSTREVEV